MGKEKKNIADEIIYKDDNSEYGIISEILGNSRFRVRLCNCKREVIGHASKSLKKNRMFITQYDLVLVNIREFETDKVDILYKYDSKQIRQLVKEKQISKDVLNDQENGKESINVRPLDDEYIFDDDDSL
jgi:initiation factor 1A